MKVLELLAMREQLQSAILIKHSGRILMIGYGSVGQCILPLVLRHIETNQNLITVLEAHDNSILFKSRHPNIRYVTQEITEENMHDILSKEVHTGDLIINVSLNIDGIAIVTWCLEHGVMYIDTSIERWKDQPDETIPNLADRTLYHAHAQMLDATAPWKDNGATSVITHGANPGLVSHFTKAAVLDIANAMHLDFEDPINQLEWAELMMRTGTKVIHISERDTQVINAPKVMNEFVNTWSCEGFWAEGRAPSELGWGTHEYTIPPNGEAHKSGPCNAVYLKQPGISTLVKSWVPIGGAFNGFVIQHSEAVTISEYFTIKNRNVATYRPTVHYAYQPCDAAVVSVHEFRGCELELQHKKRIAKDEISSGIDELGVLLMGHDLNAWWYGSQLGIDEARRLVPGENATSLQVGASMLGAIVWMLKNPNMGCVLPEELPHVEILDVALPYLGPMVSLQSAWTPMQDRNTLFPQNIHLENPWGFENFLVQN